MSWPKVKLGELVTIRKGKKAVEESKTPLEGFLRYIQIEDLRHNNSIKYDAIFLDRDGTLNPDPGYISSIKDFSFYPFTIKALKKLSSLTNHLCIVTNQSGVSRGMIEKNELDKIHSFLTNSF